MEPVMEDHGARSSSVRYSLPYLWQVCTVGPNPLFDLTRGICGGGAPSRAYHVFAIGVATLNLRRVVANRELQPDDLIFVTSLLQLPKGTALQLTVSMAYYAAIVTDS
jgi:hypothetical protein